MPATLAELPLRAELVAEDDFVDDLGSDDDEEEASEAATDEGAAVARKRRRNHSRDDELSIPREVMRQIVRHMVTDMRKDSRVDKNGMRALHAAAEAYVADIFATTQQLVHISDRTTVNPSYFQLATDLHRRIRQAAARS